MSRAFMCVIVSFLLFVICSSAQDSNRSRSSLSSGAQPQVRDKADRALTALREVVAATTSRSVSVDEKLQLLRRSEKTVREGLQELVERDPKLQRLVGASGGLTNVLETLFTVLRESVNDQNEDKKYWLSKLKMRNKINEALADYLHDLLDTSLSRKETKSRPQPWP